MEGYSTEAEQLEEIKQWWNKNGRFVVAGLVIAALVVGGWRFRNYWEARQASQAATLYLAVQAAEQRNDSRAVVKAARAVIKDYPKTAYGAFSGLALAKVELAGRHFARAEQSLRQVIQRSPDAGIAAVARLRLARIQIQAGQPREALKTLDGNHLQAFDRQVDTIRGEGLMRLGEDQAARQAFKRALALATPGSSIFTLLKMRLASLPAAAVTAPSAVTAGVTKKSSIKALSGGR